MRPFSLYVHIPYCQAKCPYCDFNSHAATEWPEQRYADALCREIAHYDSQSEWHGRTIENLFFGGGTPSLFRPESIERILDSVRSRWPAAADLEVTLEANPGTVSRESLSGFRSAGVNRLSFGVQSFAPHHLAALGRIHDGPQACDAVWAARDAGFERINIDLIYALHGQSIAEWEADLDRAIELETDHISAYNLTYEEGTAYFEWRKHGRLASLPEELELEMFERTRERLAEAGFGQYEISNYARAGQECRHNLNYWRAGDYLALGAGAHGYRRATEPSATADGHRWSNRRAPVAYMEAVERDGHATHTWEDITGAQAQGEFAFLNLRCLTGFSGQVFHERFGVAFDQAYPHTRDFAERGLLVFEAGSWRLSERGLTVADSIFSTFL